MYSLDVSGRLIHLAKILDILKGYILQQYQTMLAALLPLVFASAPALAWWDGMSPTPNPSPVRWTADASQCMLRCIMVLPNPSGCSPDR